MTEPEQESLRPTRIARRCRVLAARSLIYREQSVVEAMDVVVLRMVEEEVEDGSDQRRIALDGEAPGRLAACSDLERDAGMSRETSPPSLSEPSARVGEQGRMWKNGLQMR